MKPIYVNLEQTSKEWGAWRADGIGASDAPTIMFDSMDGSPFKLFQLKTGQRQQKRDNKFMARGRKIENEARSAYSKATGNLVPAACYEHPAFRHLRCSTDGAYPLEQPELVIELKVPEFKDTHLIARDGRVPQQYWAQCQHTLMVTGATQLDFGSYWHGDLVVVKVLPDHGYIEDQLLPAEQAFWKMILDGRWIAPEGEQDMSADEDWIHFAKRYLEVENLYVHYKQLKAEMEGQLAQLNGQRMRSFGAGVECSWTHTVRKAEAKPRAAIDTWSVSVRSIPDSRVD